MDPKRIFDTKQTEIEIDDSTDAGLIEVLYKLNNPTMADSVIQPTLKKTYLPTFRQRMEARWDRFKTDPVYSKLILRWAGVALVGLVLLLWLAKATLAPGPRALDTERLGEMQENAKVLQRLVENYAVDMNGYPAKLADLAKAGNLKDYNILRTNPLTRETGGPTTTAWCRDGEPDGTSAWIGMIGYQSVTRDNRTTGYVITLGGDDGSVVKMNGAPFSITQTGR